MKLPLFLFNIISLEKQHTTSSFRIITYLFLCKFFSTIKISTEKLQNEKKRKEIPETKNNQQ